MLSLIQMETVHNHHWLTSAEFTNIVAISQMTPGPIGINSATYCGFTAIHNTGMGNALSILGPAIATFACITIICPDDPHQQDVHALHEDACRTKRVYGLRPAVVGLLAAATIMLLNEENFGNPSVSAWQFVISILLFAATFFGTMWMKINPIHMICYAAIAGLVLLY